MYGYGIGILLDTEKFDHALQCKDRNGLTPQDSTERLGGVSTDHSGYVCVQKLQDGIQKTGT
jgi:hypothetical protein